MFEDFEGFDVPTYDNQFSMPKQWSVISAYINNLAEYKICEYVIRHTWGAGWPERMINITLDEFMYGLIEQEQRIDPGTGLSKQSVVTGIEKAMQHHLIERQTRYERNEDGYTIQVCYYGIRFCQVKDLDSRELEQVQVLDSLSCKDEQVKDLDSGIEPALEPVCAVSQTFRPSSNDSNYIHTDNSNGYIRIRQVKDFDSRHNGKYPTFIKSLIDDFSRELGDEEHIGSNIAQTTRIYDGSGLPQEQFQALLYEAREKSKQASVKKVNSRGWPNRMPYFFSVLRSACVKG